MEFKAFRASYEGINPDSPPETVGISFRDTDRLSRSYWSIFGDECLMGMLRSIGIKDVSMRLKADCDSRNPKNPKLTVEGYPAGARARFVATSA